MTMRRLLPAGILALAALLVSCQTGPPVRTGSWVVRDQLTDLDNIRTLCDEATQAGVETVVVQVRGRGDAYYQSRYAPIAEPLVEAIQANGGQGFDPLAETLAACEGHRVVAWINVFYLWGGEETPLSPDHLANARQEWILTDADGRSVLEYTMEERAKGWIEGIYADPASGGYRKHFATLTAELVERYPVDGVHLDFIRYPGPAYGQGGLLGVSFRSRYGFDPRWLPVDFGSLDTRRWLSGEPPLVDRVMTTAKLLWADLRAEQVSEMVRGVREATQVARPGVELSAAVFPDGPAAFIEKGQDWRGWVSEGLMDALYPMAYFGGKDRVRNQLAAVADDVRYRDPDVVLWAGLGAYIKEPGDIAAEAAVARELGYEGICLFDAGSLREKEGGWDSYVRRVNGPVNKGDYRLTEPAPEATVELSGGEEGGLEFSLLRAWLRARPGCMLPTEEQLSALRERAAEFARATKLALPPALSRLESEGIEVPEWRELRGVFRYVNPDDPPRRKQEQYELCVEARDRVLAGEPFHLVAAEVSQGGSRNEGGVLGRRYLREGIGVDDAVAGLGVGQVSEVVEASNGFWFFRVEAAGGAIRLDFAQTDWGVRRKVFHAALRRALAQTVEVPDLEGEWKPREAEKM